jgi:catechol 2,3-dioxygenase-like lactoylglutathione lyase family enzyme
MSVTLGFNHVATLTADLDRLTRFYVEAFGGTVTFEMAATDDHPRMAIIDLGGGRRSERLRGGRGVDPG